MTRPSDDIEPLEPGPWFEAVEQLSQRQAQTHEGGVESLLRHAYHLLQLAPRPLRAVVRCDLEEDSFEKLLDCRAFDSAAVALVGWPAGFALHCAVGDRHRIFQAAVHLPGQSKPATHARSESIAMALVGAWANCIVALRQPSSEDR